MSVSGLLFSNKRSGVAILGTRRAQLGELPRPDEGLRNDENDKNIFNDED